MNARLESLGSATMVFAAGLWTDPGSDRHRAQYQSAARQVALSFSILKRYNVTLSAGYAVDREPSDRTETEWMVSLKIM